MCVTDGLEAIAGRGRAGFWCGVLAERACGVSLLVCCSCIEDPDWVYANQGGADSWHQLALGQERHGAPISCTVIDAAMGLFSQGIAILAVAPAHGSIHFADLGFHLVVIRWSAAHGDMRHVTPASMRADRTRRC